jgi:hypothetical protein
MSLWLQKREGIARRNWYVVGLPWELAFLLFSFAIGLLIVVLRRFF